MSVLRLISNQSKFFCALINYKCDTGTMILNFTEVFGLSSFLQRFNCILYCFETAFSFDMQQGLSIYTPYSGKGTSLIAMTF